VRLARRTGFAFFALQVVVALTTAALLSLALWQVGPPAMLVALVSLLTLASLGLLRSRLSLPGSPWRRRGPGRGRGWGQRGDGWDAAGGREPRRPRPPFYPPRGEAVDPPVPSV